MATKISMKNPQTGLSKDGFYGFSWTTLFFGGFPALFRGDFLTFIGLFVIQIILAFTTMGIGSLIAAIAWAFLYNNFYTKKLIEQGYRFNASESENSLAMQALKINDDARGMVAVKSKSEVDLVGFKGSRELSSDAYQIYLGKKYGIEKNATFEKFVVGEMVFDDLNSAVNYCHSLEQAEIQEAMKPEQKFIGDTKWKYRMLEDNAVEVTNQYGGVTVYRSIEEAKKQLTWWH